MRLIFLLLSFLLLSYAASSSRDAVLDSDGDELKTGHQYYATSQFSGAHASGLELVALEPSPCPHYVAKAPPDDRLGLPLEFFPPDREEDTIREGTKLYIKFVEQTGCPESRLWYYNITEDHVTLGGTASYVPGPNFSHFALYKRSGRVYEITPFPLGVKQFDNLGVDALSVEPLLRVKANFILGVMFEKVTGISTTPSAVGSARL